MAAASTSDRSLLQRVACSPINYWAAMVTDVVAAAVLAWLGAVWYSGPPIVAVFLVLGGLLSWGFLEYLLHRWVLHGIFSAIRKEHARHHGQPRAPISTPWLVIPACATLTCATLSVVMSPGAAALATFGLYVGYNYFAIVHHLLHHRPATLARLRYFEGQVNIHELHHREPQVHFGISYSMWDRLFGTFSSTMRS
jgi:sterol desaturase/sphingolipid hydroxylase (fatty acid hydroxylase superfamily)